MSSERPVKYNVAQYALDLVENPLLADLLEDMKADLKNAFPTADRDQLGALQDEYKLIGKLQNRINNTLAKYREAG